MSTKKFRAVAATIGPRRGVRGRQALPSRRDHRRRAAWIDGHRGAELLVGSLAGAHAAYYRMLTYRNGRPVHDCFRAW